MEMIEEGISEGKGKGLFTTGEIVSGQIIISESPLLITISSKFNLDVCSICLKKIKDRSKIIKCPNCEKYVFCSEKCQDKNKESFGYHDDFICQKMRLLSEKISYETKDAMLFLVQMCSLKRASPISGDARYRCREIYNLSSSGMMIEHKNEYIDQLKHHLNSISIYKNEIELDEIKYFIAIESTNSYGIRYDDNEDTNILRGSCLYKLSSRINHSCIPNVARCDNFDNEESGVNLIIKALHDIPSGNEIFECYMPLNWDLETRKLHLKDNFEFECDCSRCQVESADDIASTMSTYIELFILKYLCFDDICSGTMIPEIESDAKIHICNKCGKSRTENEFLESLEQFEEYYDEDYD